MPPMIEILIGGNHILDFRLPFSELFLRTVIQKTTKQRKFFNMKLISKLALPVLLIVLLFLLFRGNLLSTSPYVIIAQILAIALSVWTRRSFGAGQFRVGADPAEGALLTSGAYKFIRHPMFAAALLFLWASILGHWSLTNVVIGLVVTGFIAVRIITEEQLLRTHYPEYIEYSKKTKRIIPYLI